MLLRRRGEVLNHAVTPCAENQMHYKCTTSSRVPVLLFCAEDQQLVTWIIRSIHSAEVANAI